MQRIKLRGQWEHSPNVKLTVAPERARAGDAASRTENHALTLGSRPFGSIGDSRTSLESRLSGAQEKDELGSECRPSGRFVRVAVLLTRVMTII